MSFLHCSEVAPLRVLRARADLANQATLHQAGKACARRAGSCRLTLLTVTSSQEDLQLQKCAHAGRKRERASGF